MAIGKRTEVKGLIEQYDYVAKQLILIADHKSTEGGAKDDLNEKFPGIRDFFLKGHIDRKHLSECYISSTLAAIPPSGKSAKEDKVAPNVMVPLTEMLEHSLSSSIKRIHTASQFTMEPESQPALEDFSEVFIHSIDDKYVVS